MNDITAHVAGAVELEAKFLASKRPVKARVERELRELAVKLQRKVKSEKLSGQVLNVRTGRLKRSINQRVQVFESAVVASVGTNVKYGAAWELGFDVREHERTLHFREVDSDFAFGTRTLFTTAKRSHFSRKITMKARHQNARPFLRPSLEEMTPEIRMRLARAAFLGLNG